MIELRTPHWLLGALLAASIYGAATLTYFWSKPPAASAKETGLGGIEVGLGPAGGVAGAEMSAEEIPESDLEDQKPEPLPEPTPEPEIVKETRPEQDPPPEITEAAAEQLLAEVPIPPPPQETQAASFAGFSGQSGNQDKPDFGDGDDTSGGGAVGVASDYALTLQLWLERHKEYPRNARIRRQEGVTLLYLKIDRLGQVIDYRIEQSSGYRWLDKEVRAMVKRADPFPALPEAMPQSVLEVVVPVEFELGRRR